MEFVQVRLGDERMRTPNPGRLGRRREWWGSSPCSPVVGSKGKAVVHKALETARTMLAGKANDAAASGTATLTFTAVAPRAVTEGRPLVVVVAGGRAGARGVDVTHITAERRAVRRNHSAETNPAEGVVTMLRVWR